MEADKIGAYAPLFARVSFEAAGEAMPELAFIRGFPVRSLRDLIADLERRIACTSEFDLRSRLEDTVSQLKIRLTSV